MNITNTAMFVQILQNPLRMTVAGTGVEVGLMSAKDVLAKLESYDMTPCISAGLGLHTGPELHAIRTQLGLAMLAKSCYWPYIYQDRLAILGMRQTIRNLESDKEALETDKRALESDKRALESDKRALESDKKALETDKQAALKLGNWTLKLNKDAWEIEKSALELEKRAWEVEKLALELEKRAWEVEKSALMTRLSGLEHLGADYDERMDAGNAAIAGNQFLNPIGGEDEYGAAYNIDGNQVLSGIRQLFRSG